LSFVNREKPLGILTKINLFIRHIGDNSENQILKSDATKVTKYFIAHSVYSKR